MNNQIETLLNYLLDTEATSEIVFVDNIQCSTEYYQIQYLKTWESLVLSKLQQLHGNSSVSTVNNVVISEKSIDITSNEGSNSSSSSDEDDEEQHVDKNPTRFTPQSRTTTDSYVNKVRQCQRLLQLLYHCQQNYTHFADLYFISIEQCLKSANRNIVDIVLRQIATHIFESANNDNDDCQRLIKLLPPSSALSPYQSMLIFIETLLSSDKMSFLKTYIDLLYPYTARYLDVCQEFRDSANYFIDGDSLILSVAQHKNIKLDAYHGNTIHTIFVIEKILLTLSNQSNQCNNTLVFFDNHHQLYQQQNPILSLSRSCLIAHLMKNTGQYKSIKIKQFSSWLDDEYLKYIQEEKPMFLFYHDMSTLNKEVDGLLPHQTVENLFCTYRLYANYHQFVLRCQLYLMNKLEISPTTVKCFHIQFHRACPKILFDKVVQVNQSDTDTNDVNEQNSSEFQQICQDINNNDIRLYLYLKTIFELGYEQNNSNSTALFNRLLILHVALLTRLSLFDRHLPLSIPSVTYSEELSQHLKRFQLHLASNISTNASTLSWSKIADLFDGRLFSFTLSCLSRSSTIRLDSQTLTIAQAGLKALNMLSSDTIFPDIVKQLIESNDISLSDPSSENGHTQRERQQVLRISNPFVDAYLSPILVPGDTLTFDLIHPNTSHIFQHNQRCQWQTYKEVGDDITRITEQATKRHTKDNHRFRTRGQQKLYDFYHLYGNSLDTRNVKSNQLQIVLPTAATPDMTNQENASQRSTATSASGNKKKSQQKALSKKDEIIKKNTERHQQKRLNEEVDKSNNVEARLKQFASDNYSEAIDFIEECLSNFEIPAKRLELLKKKLELERKYLRTLKRKQNRNHEENSRLEIIRVRYFATLCQITHLENITDAFHEQRKFMDELVDQSAVNAEQWYRFQLEKINSRLPRREQGVRDDRMSDVIPDRWQIEFLDAVDNKKSIIIVASTASGKTYASYYAMNKVLKEETNGVCVYVAPTKALITQVAATIFSKLGPVFGTFTPEFEMNMLTCRILVTTPDCLDMLLLSSQHQRLCQRIRYCIFDEIHCMSTDIGSDNWERAILLINCPMIGLSATVNNGQQLQKWIDKIEKQRQIIFNTPQAREVCLITHLERVADLNKYLYSNRQLHPLHPIGIMNSKQLTSRGLPKDLSLSPYETLRLSDAIKQTNSDDHAIPTLTEYFSPGWITERTLCNAYSGLVRNQFEALINNKQNEAIDSIASKLNPTQLTSIQYPERKPMSSAIADFVLTLKEKDLLPCIVFTDSYSLCEELTHSVARYFEEVENELRRTKYKQKLDALEKRLALIEKAQKATKEKKTVKSSSKRDHDEKNEHDQPAELQQLEEEEKSNLRLSGIEQQLLDGIIDEGTLANRHGCDHKVVDLLMQRVTPSHPRLARYIKRGVAYHHPKLNNKGRLAVEGLFRNRYIQVVFSTWTLALGVHMPTKTVAFVKDSVQLDALQYRQSSGRAGRRGFDVQGNIVFIDIPMPKIRHLTIAAIPNIQTRSPIGVSFFVRLLHLYSNAEDKKDAMNRSLVALQCPFYAQLTDLPELVDIQTRFHCLHTLDFLYRLNLINDHGELIGLAGFLILLRNFEPENILFSFLMDTKLFHELSTEEEVLQLLAYLFTNKPHFRTKQQTNGASLQDQLLYSSTRCLPPMPAKIRQRIHAYNSLVKQVYGGYIENVLSKMRSLHNDREYYLPFSTVSFVQSSDYDNGTFEYDLHHQHSQQSENPSISPFAGASGVTHQQFMSNYNPASGSWDLAYDLDLSTRIVPYVDIDACDHTHTGYYLNSFAIDFYGHGSDKALIAENGFERSETFQSLFKFFQSLTIIRDSLNSIVDDEKQQPGAGDASFFNTISKRMSSIESAFATNFYIDFK